MMDVDYDVIAPNYDAHRKGGGPYFPSLLRLDPIHLGGPVLELAAGTGNNTQCFLEARGTRLIALEQSGGMIAQALGKGVGGRWLQGDAGAIALASGQCRYVFAVYMLHHISDLAQLMAECLRVLQPGGVAAFVTVPTRFIERHPMNAYFPSFAKVDLARFQPFREVMAIMRHSGFEGVGAHNCIDRPRPIDASYVARVANRFISTYALLPEVEFRTGLARLREDVDRLGQLAEPIRREAIVVWGRKPGVTS